MTKPTHPEKNPAKSGIDLAGENVHWDFRKEMSYADYLPLHILLSALKQLTAHPDAPSPTTSMKTG